MLFAGFAGPVRLPPNSLLLRIADTELTRRDKDMNERIST